MSLTVDAQGTGATVSDAGGREHAHRPIMFGASLLWRERGPLPTTQGAVSLEGKIFSPQTSSSCGMGPVRRTKGWSSREEVGGWQGFSVRGGKTRGDASR